MIDTPPMGSNAVSPIGDKGSLPLTFRVVGSLVQVTGLTSGLVMQLTALLQPFISTANHGTARRGDVVTIHLEPSAAENGWRIWTNGTYLTLASASPDLALYVEWLVVSQALQRSTTTVAYHAASLALGRKAVILVAPSGSGKTTLTAGLASRGWKPLADDLTIVDIDTAALHPFRRCFHADAFTRATLSRAMPLRTPVPSVEEYVRPTRWGPDPSQAAWIVLFRRDPAEPASMTPITRAQAAGALYTSSIRNRLPRAEVARLSVRLASVVRGCWELNNSDIGATLDLLDATLRRT